MVRQSVDFTEFTERDLRYAITLDSAISMIGYCLWLANPMASVSKDYESQRLPRLDATDSLVDNGAFRSPFVSKTRK